MHACDGWRKISLVVVLLTYKGGKIKGKYFLLTV
jgi:hypothetical protein